MTEQLTLGEHLRDQGVRLVWDASEGWREEASAALVELALKGEEFTAEDIRERAGNPPRENAMGALFSKASKAGVISLVGYTSSTRPERHANRLAVWRGAWAGEGPSSTEPASPSSDAAPDATDPST